MVSCVCYDEKSGNVMDLKECPLHCIYYSWQRLKPWGYTPPRWTLLRIIDLEEGA